MLFRFGFATISTPLNLRWVLSFCFEIVEYVLKWKVVNSI